MKLDEGADEDEWSWLKIKLNDARGRYMKLDEWLGRWKKDGEGELL